MEDPRCGECQGDQCSSFWLALPALLLTNAAAASLPQLLDLRLLGVFYGVNGLLYVGSSSGGWHGVTDRAWRASAGSA